MSNKFRSLQRKKNARSIVSEDPWKVDTPFGPPRIPRFPKRSMRRLRSTLQKLSPSARAEKELLRQKNRYKIPLTERNVDALVTEQLFTDACAGPSGLVTAKTLLHSFPEGTFIPSIFEKNGRIGGLWPTAIDHGAERRLNPWIRTNLSRFTVAFSDLAWESVIAEAELSMFPQARQVGQYLEKYTNLYIPKGVLRLGKEVVRTVRETDGLRARWTVQWTSRSIDANGIECNGPEMESEEFDYLVVTSGYFAKAHFPDIPGLAGVADRVVHSSEVQTIDDVQQLLERTGSSGGKLVVIGGSMSGVEAASTVALHLSTMDFKPPVIQSGRDYEVHHISSRPFWTIPTHLPHDGFQDNTKTQNMQFLPLDLVFYDLARRPPGPVEYGLGPLSTERIHKTNAYFHSLLGAEYAKIGSFGISSSESEDPQPSWIGIGDDYAEYVRSGFIKPTIGRVSNINSASTLTVTLPDGSQETISDITAIITATGYTPFSSLSFLPPTVLSTLEYSTHDPFIPLILDGKGTSHAEIPDLGFVGFYRGPYWGAMEMQARSLANTWAKDLSFTGPYFTNEELTQKTNERDLLRTLRTTNLPRSQFPMGDYVGLMETLARDLNIPRAPIPTSTSNHHHHHQANTTHNDNYNHGPVLPSRYIPTPFLTPTPSDRLSTLIDRESTNTLKSLQRTITPSPTNYNLGMGMAIFRALNGQWAYTRTVTHILPSPSAASLPTPTRSSQICQVQGTATFHPRRTSSIWYEKEYVYEEVDNNNDTHNHNLDTDTDTHDNDNDIKAKPKRYIYRLTEGTWSKKNGQILIWNVDIDPFHAGKFSHGMFVGLAEQIPAPAPGSDNDVDGDGYGDESRYVVRAAAGAIPMDREKERDRKYEYVFRMEGVSVLEWECVVRENVVEGSSVEGGEGGKVGGGLVTRTVYRR
ncbi:hypothetical protein AbraIFM66950_011091 [Aspergillus brasiliensis]|nr:hypothetical protein AbraIFM66950_011091 [Aspergillus brasiliensis]